MERTTVETRSHRALYFYELRAGKVKMTRKMMLLK